MEDIVETGQLEGDFEGFEDENTIFEFTNGNKYQQDEYKYWYKYAYMPRAKVIRENGRLYFMIDGSDKKVRVSRAY